MTSTGPIQIPLIFDVSGNAKVFGEDISGDIIDNHFRFTITASDAQSTKFIAAMKNILYTDASGTATGESGVDASGVLFYRNGNAYEGIANAVHDIFFKSNITHEGRGTITEMFGGDNATCRGIPFGIKQTVAGPGLATDYYNDPFIDGNGTEFHKILIRIASAHLMGHPFAQGFIQENKIKENLMSVDISNQVQNHFMMTSGTAASGKLQDITTEMATDLSMVAFEDGAHNSVLQSIYEQLLMHNTVDMSGQDQSSNDISGVVNPLVFSSGNTVSFYIRPRLYLNMDASGGIQNLSTAVGNALGISGNVFNGDVSGSSTQMFNQIFSSNANATDPSGYLWLAGRCHGDPGINSDSLTQWSTNLSFGTEETAPSGAVAMFDAHVWRINVTL